MAVKAEIHQSLGTGLGYIKAGREKKLKPVGIINSGEVEIFLSVLQGLSMDLTDLREGLGKILDTLPPVSKWTYNPFGSDSLKD